MCHLFKDQIFPGRDDRNLLACNYIVFFFRCSELLLYRILNMVRLDQQNVVLEMSAHMG